jgi:CSLREA domain-containing protein
MRLYGPALLLELALASLLSGATFTVNSTGDSGDINPGDGVCNASAGGCTLRAAMEEANALPGVDTIAFSIATGAQTIVPGSSLPDVTDSVVIDGSTQPGFAGSPIIEIAGTGVNGNTDGIVVSAGNSTLRSLVVNRWSSNGIVLRGTGGNAVQGCYLGTDVSGTVAMGNGQAGLNIENSPNNLIGGTTPEVRNVISANNGNGVGGIFIQGGTSSGNTIQGNFIGTDATGTAPLGNTGRGISIKDSPDNLVGGTVPGARNIISGNRATGVRMLSSPATGNVIQGNYVGTDVTGTVFIPNSRGVQARSNNNLIGGPTPEAANLIMGNTIDGVVFFETASNNILQGNTIARNGYTGVSVYDGNGNAILSNSIYGNGRLGIELLPYGVTLNDLGDLDSGGNNDQNFPVLTSATVSSAGTTIAGTINSGPNAAYTLEFFASGQCDPSGYGEGQKVLGQTSTTTDSNGNASFSVTVPLKVAIGKIITSTATDPGGNTSEFSKCLAVTAP